MSIVITAGLLTLIVCGAIALALLLWPHPKRVQPHTDPHAQPAVAYYPSPTPILQVSAPPPLQVSAPQQATALAPRLPASVSAAFTPPRAEITIDVSGRYTPRDTVLTAAEVAFLATLQRAIPAGCMILAQVRLSALVQTFQRGKAGTYDFYRIQAKSADFVVCDAAMSRPLLVIELDDSSHQRPDRQARDAFVDAVLADVGLPILHVPWQHQYDGFALAGEINSVLGQRRVHAA